jgi:O-methyltransferase
MPSLIEGIEIDEYGKVKSTQSKREVRKGQKMMLFDTRYLIQQFQHFRHGGGPCLTRATLAQKAIFDFEFDPVRVASIWLSARRIEAENIEGSLAEVGVWRGDTSTLIHRILPARRLFLFDTFEGFPEKDTGKKIERFNETSVEAVKEKLGDCSNVVIRKGYFPETAIGLENERYAFVMCDVDLYAPTLAFLRFFYPKVTKGGYFMLHDYNCPESNMAVSKAVDEFMKNKEETLVDVPDMFGSVLFRKK